MEGLGANGGRGSGSFERAWMGGAAVRAARIASERLVIPVPDAARVACS